MQTQLSAHDLVIQRLRTRLTARAQRFADITTDRGVVFIDPRADWETYSLGEMVALTDALVATTVEQWHEETLKHYGLDSGEQSADTNQALRALEDNDWERFDLRDEDMLDLLLAWCAA
ncbi:hypothetical protein ACTXN7_11650 [Corynebacterium flavescens]|uniref:hypothetical protein n=1 Tax=Corynebacterium flavescens TaxID=28028 RepID=UPI003FD189E4